MQGELTTLTPLIRPWSMEPEYINLIRLLNEEGCRIDGILKIFGANNKFSP